jgi:branched-chain amino acid aminotransferase
MCRCARRVGILTHALHYGTGVFEGIRAYWDESAQELFIMRPASTTSAGSRTAASCASMFRSPRRVVRDHRRADARRNAFHTDLYIRPLAYKCAERIGVAIDDQDAFSSRCLSANICTATKGFMPA